MIAFMTAILKGFISIDSSSISSCILIKTNVFKIKIIIKIKILRTENLAYPLI